MHAVCVGNHRHRLAGHPDYAAVNERRPRRDTGVVDQKLRGRTVSRVDYKVMCADETRRVGRVERKRMPFDLDAGESLAAIAPPPPLSACRYPKCGRSPGARDSTARPGRDRRASGYVRPPARAPTRRGRQVRRRRRSIFDQLPLARASPIRRECNAVSDDGLSVKNPAETVRRGLDTLALSSRGFSRGGPLQELAPAPITGRLLRHQRASPSAALDKAANVCSCLTVICERMRCQSTNQSVSRDAEYRRLLLNAHLTMFAATFRGTFWRGIESRRAVRGFRDATR